MLSGGIAFLFLVKRPVGFTLLWCVFSGRESLEVISLMHFRLRKYIKVPSIGIKELHPMRHLIPALRIFLFLNVRWPAFISNWIQSC